MDTEHQKWLALTDEEKKRARESMIQKIRSLTDNEMLALYEELAYSPDDSMPLVRDSIAGLLVIVLIVLPVVIVVSSIF